MDNNKTKLGPNLIYVGWLWHDTDTVTLTGHSLPVLNTQGVYTANIATGWTMAGHKSAWQVDGKVTYTAVISYFAQLNIGSLCFWFGSGSAVEC